MDLDRMMREEDYFRFARLALQPPRPRILYGWGAEVIDGTATCLAKDCGYSWQVADGLDAAEHDCTETEETDDGR